MTVKSEDGTMKTWVFLALFGVALVESKVFFEERFDSPGKFIDFILKSR